MLFLHACLQSESENLQGVSLHPDNCNLAFRNSLMMVSNIHYYEWKMLCYILIFFVYTETHEKYECHKVYVSTNLISQY